MNDSDVSMDKLLVQRYQLKEIIGQGGMGTVYRAKDTANGGKNVAVKILSHALDDMKMIKQFQKEATVCALLSERSPNIVKVNDYGVNEEQVPFYVMEYLDGENLSAMLDIYNFNSQEFLNLSLQICKAMQIAHNGIFFGGEICPVIHRDLKPSNIFVIEDNNGQQVVKVLDFGIAQLVAEKPQDDEKIMGTPRYSSPEQLQNANVDNRSDIYSLGLIMYFMIRKKYPWNLDIDSVSAWHKAHLELEPLPFPSNLNIPKNLSSLILRCLSKSPNQRPQSVGEIIQVLENLLRTINAKQSQRKTLEKSDFSPSPSSKTLDDFLSHCTWPKNKPLQKIVFPRLVSFNNQPIPTICTMLEPEDIERRKNSIRYNQFIFQSFPHPMLLWITALYDAEEGVRWLPCYLDLKSKIGTQLINALGESKKYFVLFYSLDNPKKCQFIQPFKVRLKQRNNLKQWASVSKMLNVKHNDEAIVSRRKLKEDLALLKPEIILELEKTITQEIHG